MHDLLSDGDGDAMVRAWRRAREALDVKEIRMKARRHRASKPGVPGLLAMGLATVALSGCATVRTHQGYVFDSALLASVQPGVDNRESVQKTLGDPSFASQFDSGTWYYVSRASKQFSFGTPKPVAQTVLAVHFDPQGTVTGVQRSGLEQVVSIHPNGDSTPTLGRKRGILQELFGNIGAVGSAGVGGPTADNPNGGGGGGGGGRPY
jgi:outer membrane protein assembly factor BamE (lipoprotein component of BamABCDE complex)